VTRAVEERKMGVRGTSTTSVVLADAKVPRDNLLGEIGMGHKMASTRPGGTKFCHFEVAATGVCQRFTVTQF
jgi:alkylation response protein AidB-like acyl-CoA dehydrogenase